MTWSSESGPPDRFPVISTTSAVWQVCQTARSAASRDRPSDSKSVNATPRISSKTALSADSRMCRRTCTAPPTSLSLVTSMRRLSAGSCRDSAPELVPRLRRAGFDPVRVRLTDPLQDRFVLGLNLVAVSVDVFHRRLHLLLAQVELLGDLGGRGSGANVIHDALTLPTAK